MLRLLLYLLLLLLFPLLQAPLAAQTVPEKLAASFRTFQQDPQLRHASVSLVVVDAKTGKVLFDRNAALGLVPASTLKVITAAAAYELLGKDFRFETRFAYLRKADAAELLILPSGDPTFGSWRWPGTREEVVLKQLGQAIRNSGISNIASVTVSSEGWEAEAIPDGWLWQDIGNYYGAGAAGLNWRENQFDVFLRSGKTIGDAVAVAAVSPKMYGYELRSEVTAAAAGTGDSAYIYFPLLGTTATIRGTIPVNKSSFKIAGAMPAPATQFVHTLLDTLAAMGVRTAGADRGQTSGSRNSQQFTVFHSVRSPSLDSIMYWFNRKSINLYGEALVKAIALQNAGAGATGKGVAVIRNFWKQQGISEAEMVLADGSGLSPLNRITTQAQVRVLLHARKQSWYSGFYSSLPELNSMKMKSGTMQGVKGYCGYYRDKAGNEYAFSFLVNNYSGSSAAVSQKMYRLLDALK